ncbi:MAG: hypothetical protein CMLOHMNK_02059 [Steroidobacteraceae bacterium]|nr:hypothetical protein [Steroidobacteraceae bacterium]
MMDFLTPHPFLEQFAPSERSAISNDFLYTIRRLGPSCTPKTVCKAVWAETKATRWRSRSERLLSALAADPQAALDYAANRLAWEALPDADKRAVKDAKRQAGVAAWMEEQPPTEKQLAYLEGLGCRKTPSNRREASEWIDRLAQGRTP